MSLTTRSRIFTISTYDPPSTPIALKAQNTGSGQRLGDRPRERKSTPPQQDSDFRQLLRHQAETPPVKAKVLPWVSGIETEGYQPPEGMFGPYDSQPPTRVQSLHETEPQTQTQRSVHPFAYAAGSSLPFAALAGDGRPTAPSEPSRGQHRPESEVLSRGAGMRVFSKPQDATPGAGLVGGAGQETPEATDTSPGFGTFGREPSQSGVHRKPVPPLSAALPPGGPLPTPPKPPSRAQGIQSGVPAPPSIVNPLRDPTAGAHIHHSHPEFPFKPEEAVRVQDEAMKEARAQALAQLEAPHPVPSTGNVMKGPRITYDTQTSGPSFGHIHHKDGVPMSRHISLQEPEPPSQSEQRGSFFRIPFGVPMGMTIPRPLMISRNSVGLGVGLGIPGLSEMLEDPHLSRVAESPEYHPPRGDRSAYVETVQDEQEPTVQTISPARSRNGQSAALAESGIQPKTHSATATFRGSAPEDVPRSRPASVAPTPPSKDEATIPPMMPPPVTPRAPVALQMPLQGTPDTSLPTPDQTSALPLHTATVPTSVPNLSPEQARALALASQLPTQGTITPVQLQSVQGLGTAFSLQPDPQRNVSYTSQATTAGSVVPPLQEVIAEPEQITPAQTAPSEHNVSIAPTTASRVQELVKESKFHDDILCQLLDAARLNLIGGEAKKALNRAARERVIQLKDLREHGSLAEDTMSKDRTKKSSKSKHSKRSGSKRSYIPEAEVPPQWAQDIISRLTAFDERFAQLERKQSDEPAMSFDEGPHNLIQELLFNGLGGSDIPRALMNRPGMPMDFPFSHTSPQGAYLRTVSPTEVAPRRGENGEVLSWGSEVELPPPGVQVTPPKTPKTPKAPLINIQAPTESNLEKSQRANTPSQGTQTPKAPTVPAPPTVTSSRRPIVVPDPTQRSLPTTPDESIRSRRPSTEPKAATTKATTVKTTTPPQVMQEVPPLIPFIVQEPTVPPPMQAYPGPMSGMESTMPVPMAYPPQQPISTEETQTGYKTALEASRTPPPVARDRIHLSDPIAMHGLDPTPWDLVTQRLYSWALVWEEKTFLTALEEISLGKQVDEFALSIFVMMTFKRLLRRNLSETPQRVCDKLFVPPTMANAINQAVHSKNFSAAQQMLEELWYPFLFRKPPRIIIVLSRHRNDADHWTAHRYDLPAGTLRSYSVTHEEVLLKDGRPFMWWHAIRAAWPEYKIPDPDTLTQRMEIVKTLPETKDDNSLEALNHARNLFVGFRPEHPANLTKLRENVWGEVKRLLQKKRNGHLVVDMDSPGHVNEL